MYKSKTTRHARAHRRAKQITTVRLKPGEGKTVPIGWYERGICEPELTYCFEPEISGDVQISSTRIDEEGGYLLSLYIQSFSSSSCRVKIDEKCV